MEEYYKHKLLSQSTMSNPTLINGFEDIVNFIKQQEHRNQKLQEENGDLKEKVQEGVSVCEGVKESMEEMFEYIKKLEEENGDLKSRLEDVNHTAQEWEDSYNQLKQESEESYNELKQENKKQKQDHIKSMMNTNKIAKELYREVKYSLGYGEFDEPDRKDMYEEIKKLTTFKEEVKEILQTETLSSGILNRFYKAFEEESESEEDSE